MDQKTLANSLRCTQKLVNMARAARSETFKRLSPDCKRRYKRENTTWLCRLQSDKHPYSPICQYSFCPYVQGTREE